MKKLILVSALVFSAPSLSYSPFAFNTYKERDLNVFQTLNVRILSSLAGDQRLYFNYDVAKFEEEYNGKRIDFDVCKNLTKLDHIEEGRVNDTVLNINGVNVKMNTFCYTYSDANDNFLQFTPATYKGIQYTLEQFRKSEKVNIVSQQFGFDLNVTAIGFSKAWASFGGDAI